MKLLRLGQLKFGVFAIYDDRDECPVMETLQALARNNSAAKRMLHTLRHRVPETGPNFRNSQKVEKLRGASDIFAFREQPKRGPKIRVLFFKDGQDVVICTDAFAKRDKVPSGVVERAVEAKNRYEIDKRNKQITIEVLVGDDDE